MKMQNKFSIITSCKNRLEHLKHTLPLLVQFPNSEVIVVDYGCQEGTSTWVAQHFPAVTIVKIKGNPRFNLSHARNIGAQQALHNNLVFLDADTIITPELGNWLNNNVAENTVFVCVDKPDLGGFLSCKKNDFNKIGQYDEAFIFWGGEDIEIKERFYKAGTKFAKVKPNLLNSIEHADNIRDFHEKTEFNNRKTAIIIERTYRQIKMDIMNINPSSGMIPLPHRVQFMQNVINKVEEMLSKNLNSIDINIQLGSNSKQTKDGLINRQLSYKIFNPSLKTEQKSQ